MPLPPTLHCGPAGWSYPHWDGVVYPENRNRNFHPLEYLSNYFDALEINSSFCQPIRPELSKLWIRKVAGNPKFQFTLKMQRSFTHERKLDPIDVREFKDGLWPLKRTGKLGCVLMQFPWAFRFTEENRDFVVQLRRTFHEFPLVAEMRHGSWLCDEAIGALIDYRIGFCNIDQAPYIKAMPPASKLTSDIGYVRLRGRNPRDWEMEFNRAPQSFVANDYLYSPTELQEWRDRIEEVRQYAARTFVVLSNDAAGQAVVNSLQLAQMLGDGRRVAPAVLKTAFAQELAAFQASSPAQVALFDRSAA